MITAAAAGISFGIGKGVVDSKTLSGVDKAILTSIIEKYNQIISYFNK